jgi:hypothetical protein
LNSSVYAALLPFSVIISHLLDRQLYTRLRSTFFRGNLNPDRFADEHDHGIVAYRTNKSNDEIVIQTDFAMLAGC